MQSPRPLQIFAEAKEEVTECEVGPAEVSPCLDLDYEDFITTWGAKISSIEVCKLYMFYVLAWSCGMQF
eukprot:7916063-Pyramimonas_sp.AAC.2